MYISIAGVGGGGRGWHSRRLERAARPARLRPQPRKPQGEIQEFYSDYFSNIEEKLDDIQNKTKNNNNKTVESKLMTRAFSIADAAR